MLYQKEVNDCVIVSLANYISIVLGFKPDKIYNEILSLFENPDVVPIEEYSNFLDGAGISLDIIPTIAAQYHIALEATSSIPPLDHPFIIIAPVDLDRRFKYDCHVMLWTGSEIHDPVQFEQLRTTEANYKEVLAKSYFYVEASV